MAYEWPNSGGADRYGLTPFAIPQAAGTFAVRFYPFWDTSDSTLRYLFRAHLSSGGTYVFDVVTDATTWYVGWFSNAEYRITFLRSASGHTANAWNTLVYRWDDTANTSEVFVNGTSKGTGSTLVTWDTSTATTMRIGNVQGGSPANSFYGRLADIGFYDVAWDDAQVAAFNAGYEGPTITKQFGQMRMVGNTPDATGTMRLSADFANVTFDSPHPPIYAKPNFRQLRKATGTVRTGNNLLLLGVG